MLVLGISTISSAGAIGSFFEPTIAIAGLIIAAAAYGIAKIIKSIKGTKYHQPVINDDTLHHLKQKQRKSKNKRRKSSNNNNKDPKKPSLVDNMEKFFLTGFGKKIYDCVEKTKKHFQGQQIYRVIKTIKGTPLKKGDLFYLDGFHKDHLEVFNNKGIFKSILNFNGERMLTKMAQAAGRRLLL